MAQSRILRIPALLLLCLFFASHTFGADKQAESSLEQRSPIRANLEFDLTRGLSIGGREVLRRAAYFNIHGTPAELTAQELKWLSADLRANFGRSMGSISSFMHGLTEDPSRPGFADPAALKKRALSFAEQRNASYRRVPEQVDLINSVHPYSYYGKKEDQDKSGTVFRPGTHAAAAEILAAYFNGSDIKLEPYFEVANECNVQTREVGTTFEDMCNLHSTLAKRLHREIPELKIGGPTSAWPAFEFDNFRIWREQMGMFIDRAGKDMDFLSVHLYTTHWDDKTVNRFGANIDAILDLMESQSLLSTGSVKPLLISECGTGLRTGERIMEEYSPYRDWLVLRGANHVFMNLIRRDDRIIKMVPFIVTKATWYRQEQPYPWVLFHKRDDKWVPTHLAKWYEFWQAVDGRHLPTRCSSLDVQTHALLNGRSAFLLVDNLTDQTVQGSVTIALPKGIEISSSSISRLYYDGQQPRLAADQPLTGNWKQLQLQPQESCIVKLELSSVPELKTTIVESTCYADRTVQPIETRPAYFGINAPAETSQLKSATLRIGYGRAVALSQQPKVKINGKTLQVPDDERGVCTMQGNDQFTTKEINVPVDLLKKTNRIAIQFPQPGGHVSSAVLVLRAERRTPNSAVAVTEQAKIPVLAFE